MLPYSNSPFMSPPKTVKYKQIFQGLSVSDVLFLLTYLSQITRGISIVV